MITPSNTLFYGDCLRVLTDDIAAQSVDLIYLDPPFNSKRDYNIPLGGKAQASVFQDTWVWSKTQDESLDYVAERDANLYQQLNWLLKFAGGGQIGGGGGLPAYLAYMAARLLACKRVLKDTGSIYLHCDPTAGHYLKLLMDGVFGTGNFQNQIIWKRSSAHSNANRCGSIHDVLLFYSKSSTMTWNKTYQKYDPLYIQQYYRYSDKEGRIFASDNLTAPVQTAPEGSDRRYDWKGVTRVWRYSKEYMEELDSENRIFYTKNGQPRLKRYLNESKGLALQDIWSDVQALRSWHKERLGYPTQKPLALLERIIRASSNPGDLVLDPFCGCGTAVEAAQNLGRRWLGIDVEPLAVDLMARRLRDRCGVDPQIRGIPYDFEQAQRLAANAPYEFERWAIRLIPGAQPNFKQSGDGGLDGRAVVASAARPQPLFGFQVKGGQSVGRPVLDAFHGALTMNGCAAGLLVVLEEQTAYRLRANLGAQERVQLNGWNGPRIGVWSVEDWLEGRRGAPVPPLIGAGETLELLRPQAWQRRLDAGVSGAN